MTDESTSQTTDRLARIETKVDLGFTSIDEHFKTLNGAVAKQESRVRQLEDTHLVIDGRNNIMGRIKAWLFTNGASVVVALLIAYLLVKLRLN